MVYDWKVVGFFFFSLAFGFIRTSLAYSVIPLKGETNHEAHERVFGIFVDELKSLRLDSSAIKAFRKWIKQLPADRSRDLQDLRWPSFYETIFKAKEPWPDGPRSERMKLENMRIIYADLLHYAFYLNYYSTGRKESQVFSKHFANILGRAREAMVLDSLRDQEGQSIEVSQDAHERVLREYVLEEIIQYLVFSMETVVSQGWEIVERNWHPESFWHEKLRKLGGRLVYQVSDRDLLADLRDSHAHPAPILLLGESKVGTPDFRINLSREEKTFFLRYFLSLKLPVNTPSYVSTLNRKFHLREKLRARRLRYLEEKRNQNKDYDPNGTEFLNPGDL